MSNVLSKLGLSKEQVAKLLKTPVTNTPKEKPKQTRRWLRLPDEIRKAIQQEHHTMSYREISLKYNISMGVAYTARTGKVYRHKTKKSH